jgi:hypothetical protein
MKPIKSLSKLLVAAVLLVGMFAACEGPQGPAGPVGPQGDPGPGSVVNWEGYKEGIQCATCHSADYDTVYYVAARVTQWEESKHGSGTAYIENSSTCAPCHTTEGFVQSSLGITVTGHMNSTRPGCFACHSPHARGDFSLRTTEAVTMLAGIAGQADYTFDYGKGNLCAACHKPRSISPKPDPTKTAATDSIVITSSRWYQHYGVQGSMLSGQGGFEFQGYNYFNSPHTNQQGILDEGCVICHMAQEERNPAGGHTMWLDYDGSEMLAGCNTTGCHNGNLEELDYHGVQTEVEELLDTLHTLLLNRGWITASGSVNASSSNPLVIKPAYLSGAMYNYFYVEHDGSMGVHNTGYTRLLLESSIEVLNEE